MSEQDLSFLKEFYCRQIIGNWHWVISEGMLAGNAVWSVGAAEVKTCLPVSRLQCVIRSVMMDDERVALGGWRCSFPARLRDSAE